MINSYKDKLERGVSPVVGVILMVAVTVILAAVIGSFVLDLGGSVSQSAQAGLTFDQSGNDVDVQLTTVQTADSIWVTGASSYSGGVASGDFTSADNVGPSSNAQYLLTRNDSGGPGTIVTATASGSGDTISVIGEVDGSESVIQTYTTD